MEENKQWLVFWKNNARIGSLEKTEANLRQMKSICDLQLIQEDATGTVHYEVRQKGAKNGKM